MDTCYDLNQMVQSDDISYGEAELRELTDVSSLSIDESAKVLAQYRVFKSRVRDLVINENINVKSLDHILYSTHTCSIQCNVTDYVDSIKGVCQLSESV